MIRMCALPDDLHLDATLSRWNKRRLTWTITGALPEVAEEDQRACYAAAFAMWAAVCNLEFEYTDNARVADIRMGSGQIDGRGRTLAWSELPNGSDGPLQQKYDTSEAWSAMVDIARSRPELIPLLITAAHEIGHAIGIGHSNDQSALMFPSLNRATLGRPQTWDVREALARYGPPKAAPPVPVPPAPTPSPGKRGSILIDLDAGTVRLPTGFTVAP